MATSIFTQYLDHLTGRYPDLAAHLEQERRYAAMTPVQRFVGAMNVIARTPEQVALREENARRLLRRAHGRAIYSGPLARRFVMQAKADLYEEWEEENWDRLYGNDY